MKSIMQGLELFIWNRFSCLHYFLSRFIATLIISLINTLIELEILGVTQS
jgi:hypothetical protein